MTSREPVGFREIPCSVAFGLNNQFNTSNNLELNKFYCKLFVKNSSSVKANLFHFISKRFILLHRPLEVALLLSAVTEHKHHGDLQRTGALCAIVTSVWTHTKLNYLQPYVAYVTLWAGISTYYGVEGPGIQSRWERFFALIQTGPVQ